MALWTFISDNLHSESKHIKPILIREFLGTLVLSKHSKSWSSSYSGNNRKRTSLIEQCFHMISNKRTWQRAKDQSFIANPIVNAKRERDSSSFLHSYTHRPTGCVFLLLFFYMYTSFSTQRGKDRTSCPFCFLKTNSCYSMLRASPTMGELKIK